MKKYLFYLIAFCFSTTLQAQYGVTGIVTDQNKEPLIGATVFDLVSGKGTVTDIEGKYTLELNLPKATLRFSYTGFQTIEIAWSNEPELNVTLEEGLELGEINVVGTRSSKRTATDTPVAIDVIDLSELANQNGNIEINRLLQYAAPSFNATKQSGSDGADHIDPASLRGLGPDQTLVLINGKRRHQSSLVNIFGTRGRGNTGSDLNAIPAAAIKRIEILRDGASAQYGSDAIAGVINIVLQDDVEKLTGSISVGAYNPIAEGDFPSDAPNIKGNFIDPDKDGVTKRSDDPVLDGQTVKINANYGLEVGNGGFANFTTEYISRQKTLRPGAAFRRGMGEAAIDGFNFFVNSAVPINKKTEFYLFGGSNYRDTDAYAFTRNLPTERAVVSIYPNGFTPRITSIIRDNSVSAGIRTTTEKEWNIDINNTFGVNNFHYYIKGTNNASLGIASPTDMDAGGHSLSQNTTSIDFSKYYSEAAQGINLAFGVEQRVEQFQIFAGEPASYGTFDVDGLLIERADQVIPTDPITGEQRPGGSQGFPGYSPANEVDRSRSNFALYADAEFDLTTSFLVSAAARFERYSDFGNTLNGKLSSRLKLSDHFSLRGSISSGFRAPSLAQIYYNLRFTAFVDGKPSETLLSANNSPVTRGFGIQPLKQEEALNTSLGFALKAGDFTATVDGYYITVQDRIALTGYFDAAFLNAGVNGAAFFANGIDTKTLGLDIVATWRKGYYDNIFEVSVAGNLNELEITNINNRNLDLNTFFGAREQSFLIASAPSSKFVLNLGYERKALDINLIFTRFGAIELVNFGDEIDEYDAKIVTDFTIGYDLSKQFNFTLGANNLLNRYPTQQDPNNTDGGGYWDAVQMGFGGAYYFARLGFNF